MPALTGRHHPVLRLLSRVFALILAVALTVELAGGLRQAILDAYRDLASAPQFANAPAGSNIVVIPPENLPRNTYMQAIIDKENALTVYSAPRVILVGGSNLAFGIDSPRMSRTLGRTTINMGLHAGLGLTFMLNQVQPYIRRGDVIVIVPEYQLFAMDDAAARGSPATRAALEFYPDAERFLGSATATPTSLDRRIRQEIAKRLRAVQPAQFPLQELIAVLGGRGVTFPDSDVAKRSIDRTQRIYRRTGFNSQGDMVAHLNEQPLDASKFPMNDLWSEFTFTDFHIASMNRFATDAAAKGARVMFAWPVIMRPAYDLNTSKVDALDAYLRGRLVFPMLSRPDEFALAPSQFYDTIYHLNAAGRRMRSDLLAEKIKTAGAQMGLWAAR